MFRRRSPSSQSAHRNDSAAADAAKPGGGASGKGRPTPSRRDAEAARRQRVRPKLDRRAAARARREQVRAQRMRVRRAMVEGDERNYLSRDKGPVRRFVRDFVDSRRSVAEFFLPLILVVLVLSFVPVTEVQLFSTALWLGAMVVVIFDVVFMGMRLRRELRRRFPADIGRGHVLYGLARMTQLRRLRLPKPAVRPGERV